MACLLAASLPTQPLAPIAMVPSCVTSGCHSRNYTDDGEGKGMVIWVPEEIKFPQREALLSQNLAHSRCTTFYLV